MTWKWDFLEVASMVVTWLIVFFWCRVPRCCAANLEGKIRESYKEMMVSDVKYCFKTMLLSPLSTTKAYLL